MKAKITPHLSIALPDFFLTTGNNPQESEIFSLFFLFLFFFCFILVFCQLLISTLFLVPYKFPSSKIYFSPGVCCRSRYTLYNLSHSKKKNNNINNSQDRDRVICWIPLIKSLSFFFLICLSPMCSSVFVRVCYFFIILT